MKSVIIMLALAFATTASAQEYWSMDNRSGNQQHEPHIVSGGRRENEKGAPHRDEWRGHERIAPATREDVEYIIEVLKKTSFDDDKLKVAKLAVTLRPVMAADLAAIAKTFAFDKQRKDFLLYAHSFCPDRHHYDMMESAFSLRSNYHSMMKEIRKRRAL